MIGSVRPLRRVLAVASVLTWPLVALALASLHGGVALAQDGADGNILMLADEVTYDDQLGLVTARGSVELARGERVLRADTLSYNMRSDMVTASGNVAVIEPSGDVIFADYIELTGDLKSGAITGLGILLTDGSRMAAAGGRKMADGRTDMRKVVYSPCNLCDEHPDEAPLWQIKAYRVVHDAELKTIFYNDAILELFGVPVFYFPFFSHPDPSVRRKSGFLPPSFGRNSSLGAMYQQPYYFNISPHTDATLAPIMTTDEGPVLVGEFRQATETGYYTLNGSITRGDRLPEDDRLTERTRGHINAVGEFALNPYWDYGFAIERATDQTYLGRYGFGRGLTSLTQNVYMRGIRENEYVNLDAYYFQSLDASVRENSVPIILPLIDYGWRGDPGYAGGIMSLNANGRIMERPKGADSQRLSITAAWQRPNIGSWGDVSLFKVSLRADGYHVNDVPNPQNPNAVFEGFTGRVVPQVEYFWRLPLVRSDDGSRQVVEPIVQAIAAPNGGNPIEVPNEDSLSFEFDDTTLLNANRFPGLDRVEGGMRVNYALRIADYRALSGRSELLFGQTYRVQDDDTFEDGTGLAGHRSDYVGRLTVAPSSYFNLGLRFRLDHSNFAVRRLSMSTGAGPDWLRGSVSYTSLSDTPTAGVPSTVEQIYLAGVYKFADYWKVSGYHQRDLGEPGGSLLTGFGVSYEDECILFTVGAQRNFTSDRDIEDSTNFSVQVRLRNLG